MLSLARTALTSAVVLSLVLPLSACGGKEAGPTPAARTPERAGDAMGMVALANRTVGDMAVSLEAMAPETFYVSEGARLRRQAPARDARAHMMFALTDTRSGIRLPDASVTLRLVGPGGTSVFDGPLYPMVGRGMGMHYGENVALPRPGTYRAELVVGPPRIGRHADSRDAWTKPARVETRFRWDGRRARAGS